MAMEMVIIRVAYVCFMMSCCCFFLKRGVWLVGMGVLRRREEKGIKKGENGEWEGTCPDIHIRK